jgi:lipopolysaccharide export system permease protein
MVLVRRLDRYVLGEFLRVLVITLLALTAVYVMVHLMDHIDVYLDQNATWGAIARYYLLQLPYNSLLTLPMAMLIGTILSIGELGKHGELTAMKSSGISLYRIVTPIVLFAFLVSLGTLVLGETVVPRLNERANDVYEKEVIGEGEQFENYRGNFVYQDRDGYTYIVRSLFVEESLGSADQVEIQRKLEDGTFVRINAPNMVWEPSAQRWVLRDGEIRVFPAGGDEQMYTFMMMRSPDLDDHPEELLAEEKDPEEMGYYDLDRYIADRERLGVDTRTLRVDLHLKLSYPFANLIIVLFGLAVVGSAAHAGRHTGTVGFGVALFLTIVFWGFLRVSQGLGYGGGLEPSMAAWLANAVFAVVAVILLARART